MATWEGQDQDTIRLQDFQLAVHNVQARASIMKTVVGQSTVGAAKVSFFQETAANRNATRPLGRWEPFPNQDIQYSQIDAYIDKFGHEGRISLEDILMHNVPVHERMAMRLGHGVAIAVDQRIWGQLSENQSAVNIRTIAAGATSPGGRWDDSTIAARRPFEDLLKAVDAIVSNDNQAYDPDTALISPYDWTFLLTNDTIMANSARRTTTGTGELELTTGLTLKRSNVVTDDFALVCQKIVCATWVSPQGMQVLSKDEPGHGRIYRAFEFGQLAVHDPSAVCLITNTQT